MGDMHPHSSQSWVYVELYGVLGCVYVAIDRKDGNSDVRGAGDSLQSDTQDVEKYIPELTGKTFRKIFIVGNHG